MKPLSLNKANNFPTKYFKSTNSLLKIKAVFLKQFIPRITYCNKSIMSIEVHWDLPDKEPNRDY